MRSLDFKTSVLYNIHVNTVRNSTAAKFFERDPGTVEAWEEQLPERARHRVDTEKIPTSRRESNVLRQKSVIPLHTLS